MRFKYNTYLENKIPEFISTSSLKTNKLKNFTEYR